MANTLTGLIPVLYEAMDVVSREMTGAIAAVSRDSTADMAAKDQVVRSAVTPEIAAENITPGATPADSGDQTLGYVDVSITKARAAPIRWAGEEQLSVRNQPNILRDQFTQAMRVLVNEVEADIAALYANASRAYGTAGTTPFGTAGDLSDAAQVRRILEDNGAPTNDIHLVLGSAAIANLRGKQSVLFKLNESGTDDLLRRGNIGDIEGFMVHNSAQTKLHTKGTGASYAVDLVAGYAVGDTDVHVDTGTGTILAGDVATFAGDTNKYIITTGFAGDGDGDIVLAANGLREALADDVAMTIGNSYTANMAFSRNAIQLVTRAPAMPEGGDDADDVTTVVDPNSGLAFQVAVYRQYRRVKYEIGLAWGVKVVKPEHLAILLG